MRNGVFRSHAVFPFGLSGALASFPAKIRPAIRCHLSRQALGQERGDHPGQHIAGAAFCHARAACRDEIRALCMSDHGGSAFEQQDDAVMLRKRPGTADWILQNALHRQPG